VRKRSSPDVVALDVVALGGGHGLAASLKALRHLTERLTAVVTVADDGGSSGRLRRELGVLPPGDLRMALSALCDDGEWGRTWSDVLQHRFSSEGNLHEHAVGNLLIVALWELLGDPVAGLDWVARLLGSRGRVLPMSTVPLEIEADVLGLDGNDGVTVVRGQAAVATTAGRVSHVRMAPVDAAGCPQAVAAVRAADWVVLGPGSWYTSVIPHLLVPELADALVTTRARRCVTLNLASPSGETEGLTSTDHLRVLGEHAPGLRLDVVLADERTVDDVDALSKAADGFGAQLVLRRVRAQGGRPQHDPLRLAAAFRDVFESAAGEPSGER
jgi:uncharacterized cofD-like protein